MKKTLLTTLIAASISTAPLANELGKLKFATDSAAQAPVQKIAVQEKVAQKSASSKTEGADTIPELIFDHTDISQLAVLTPDEMTETEGAAYPLLVALISMNAGVWTNHVVHKHYTGEYASIKSTSVALATSAIPAARALYGTRFANGAVTTTFGRAHNYAADTILFGTGVAASINEAKSIQHRSTNAWRGSTAGGSWTVDYPGGGGSFRGRGAGGSWTVGYSGGGGSFRGRGASGSW